MSTKTKFFKMFTKKHLLYNNTKIFKTKIINLNLELLADNQANFVNFCNKHIQAVDKKKVTYALICLLNKIQVLNPL